ncbi:glutamate synthase-related protein [Thiohalophilus sp.]|uniref:glutamate synthase-related protein n=1 Tax=Thiohalophilus sp. TaxID=3028392 RepID=UPI002ACE84CB|nr:glutamate synthase-related protein [Thiohalophilus sp.]MDZ7662194.1 glutamate synthase-related protein [Thiohalophilus sp.]
MANKPLVADNKPAKVNLSTDQEYYFCVCGRSQNQPFCDGSHAGTGFEPLAFTPQKEGEAFLCNCKHSGNLPYCDGSHNRFGESMIGKEGPGTDSGSDDDKQGDDKKAKQPDPNATEEEPTLELIHQLAKDGLETLGRHGPVAAMGVPRHRLPGWDDIQIMVAQLHDKPLDDDAKVDTELVIGPQSQKPLCLKTPLLVSDMSFGSLSEEARLALAKGAEQVGTGICSGEGGMLPEEQQANSRYLFELGSAGFGYDETIPEKVQAFHFKGGQAAKTGTGGHLPGAKVSKKIAAVRGIPEGESAYSPPTFADLREPADFKRFADRVRAISGGIPVGFKLSANHIERDIEFALQAGADYVILDGRGGGTGASPLLFRDHISVPTIAALARARRYLDQQGVSGKVTLIITGGLRTPADFIKALALGADGIALANSAIQAIGCVAARICHTNQCPSGVATQDPELRKRLDVDDGAHRLARFLQSSTRLMQVMARACGHARLDQFKQKDLATFDYEMARLSGIVYAGMAGQP